MAKTLKIYLLRYLRELRGIAPDDLLRLRYQTFRRMGVFENGTPQSAPAAAAQ
jgi:acetyl-CoA carboxylase alpha subunit